MNVDRFLPPASSAREAPASALDPLEFDGALAQSDWPGHTDRIVLGASAASRLAGRSVDPVSILECGEDARMRIAIGGRTLTLEDGIYSLR